MAGNPCPQLSDHISKLPLEILRATARRKIAKHLDSGDAEQESTGYINLARLAGFSDSNIEVFSKEKSPTEALLAEWEQRKPTVGQLFERLQFLGRDDVIKDCIKNVENDAKLFITAVTDDTTAINLTPTGERKTKLKPTLNGIKETENKKQTPDPETTFPSDLDDSAAFDKFLLDETNTATIHDLRNPGEEKVRYDAFVSVNFDSKKDLKFVKEMADILENKFKMKLFIPLRDSIPGSAEHSMSAYLIDVRCNKVIVILSKSFLKSSACDFQLKFAQCLHPSVRTKKIIPVMIEHGTTVPLILRFVTVCDFTQSEMGEWILERLICALRAPVPEIKIGEEDPDDDYTTDTSLHELKLELKTAAFKEIFIDEVDEEQSNTESTHDFHNPSALAQSQNSSSLDPKEKPKENIKKLLGSFINMISKRKGKKHEKAQKEEEEFSKLAMRLVKIATEEDLINEKDAKTTSENKKHGLNLSGAAKDISGNQIAKSTYSKQKMPVTGSNGYAMLHDPQEPMPFNLKLDDHGIHCGRGTPSSKKYSATDTQGVECKEKKQQNMKNCEADLNTAAIGQAHFHCSSRQSPVGYLTHTAANTNGRGNRTDHSVGQFPIYIMDAQKTHPSSLKMSDNIPLSQGSDESHNESKHKSHQTGTFHTFMAKDQSEEKQLRTYANKLAISQGTEGQNSLLGNSVSATGATVLQRLEKNASSNDRYNRDRADPVFV
ncbi:hypothetical protein CHS0354_010585 [Potamilus streckersoni]|uniref:Myeloid differentiation factor 88 n=1 Tax=Potamilus streckersoni TaxID=2493646 RepID=A0AAE0S5Z6_9BIVA|nr:hypothetical protein CHS0354_010585 [Potamilus streckersoni]